MFYHTSVQQANISDCLKEQSTKLAVNCITGIFLFLMGGCPGKFDWKEVAKCTSTYLYIVLPSFLSPNANYLVGNAEV